MHGPVHLREIRLQALLLTLSATPTAHLTCDRPYSCSFQWGAGWLGGSPQRVDLCLARSTPVIYWGSWTLAGRYATCCWPIKWWILCLPSELVLQLERAHLYSGQHFSPPPSELWEPISIPIGINPSSRHHKLTCKWCIWPLWPSHRNTENISLYFQAKL